MTTTEETMVVPVCALCRVPVGAGMKVVIFHPDMFWPYAIEHGVSERDRDDEPVLCCLPCGNKIRFAPAFRGPS